MAMSWSHFRDQEMGPYFGSQKAAKMQPQFTQSAAQITTHVTLGLPGAKPLSEASQKGVSQRCQDSDLQSVHSCARPPKGVCQSAAENPVFKMSPRVPDSCHRLPKGGCHSATKNPILKVSPRVANHCQRLSKEVCHSAARNPVLKMSPRVPDPCHRFPKGVCHSVARNSIFKLSPRVPDPYQRPPKRVYHSAAKNSAFKCPLGCQTFFGGLSKGCLPQCCQESSLENAHSGAKPFSEAPQRLCVTVLPGTQS